jgi:hypothetical protein
MAGNSGRDTPRLVYLFFLYRSHCVMVQTDKLQSPEDLFLRSFELQKIE